MARKSKKAKLSSARIGALVAIGLLVVLAIFAWQYRKQLRSAAAMTSAQLTLPAQTTAVPGASTGTSSAAATSAPDAIVKLSGKLQIHKPAKDAQLGVSADDAVILFRIVEMYQWQEHCDNGACGYGNGWSDRHIDSSKFRQRSGHENPAAPFADARFVAGDVRLDDVIVDPELIAQAHPAIDYAVRANALPPNLAATFNVVDGVLYAGGDAAQPQVGTLRVRYKIVPGGEISLSGVRRGAKLDAH